MGNHTPGPWVVADGHYPSFKNVVGPSFKISAVMWATDLNEGDYEARTADLHLIAAAPDLLEALERLSDQCDRWRYLDQKITDAEKNARAVINKAKGA